MFQLILIGLDYDESASNSTFTSELGSKLLQMKNIDCGQIDPTEIKKHACEGRR